MKKVLIVPSNTDLNRGDQSLTWASVDIAKSVFNDNVEIYLYRTKSKLADRTKTNHQTEQLGFPLLTRILSHPRRNDTTNEVRFSKLIIIKWGMIAMWDLIVTLSLLSRFSFINGIGKMLLSKDQLVSYDAFAKLDALFVKGGGFLHSYGSFVDPYIMYFQLFDVFLAKKKNIPVFVLPNSIGPLKNKWASKIVLKALKSAKIVTVREGVSNDFMNKVGVSTFQSPDLGFYLSPSKMDYTKYLLKNRVQLKGKKNVAITVRPYRFDGKENADELYARYIENIYYLINSLLDHNIGVTLMAHTIGPSAHEDDSIPLREIYDKFNGKEGLVYLYDRELNSKDIEKLYSYYDLVIGTRFHSVIFSLNVGTPAIAIAYGGNKAYGIMKDIGLSEYVVPIENPNHELILVHTNTILKSPEVYLKKVKEYKEVLLFEREKLISKIQEALK